MTTSATVVDVAFRLASRIVAEDALPPADFSRFVRVCRTLGYRPEDVVEAVR